MPSNEETVVLSAFRGHGDLPDAPPYADIIARRVGDEDGERTVAILEHLTELGLLTRAGKDQPSFPNFRYWPNGTGFKALDE